MKEKIGSIYALAKKELYSHLISPVFYGATVFFLTFSSVWFIIFQNYLRNTNYADLRVYFSSFLLVFIFVIPALTMKSWAEERKTGSIELLLTMPFSEWSMVLGKFFSVFTIMLIMLVLTIPLPLTMTTLGDFDIGVIVCEYIGTILLGGAAIALGLMFSSFCKNQAGSFLGSFIILAVILLVIPLAISSPFFPDWFKNVLKTTSIGYIFNNFTKGILDSRDIIYYLANTFLFLFITTRIILYRKWR